MKDYDLEWGLEARPMDEDDVVLGFAMGMVGVAVSMTLTEGLFADFLVIMASGFNTYVLTNNPYVKITTTEQLEDNQ